LDEYDEIQARRMSIWSTYRHELEAWVKGANFTFQACPEDREHPAHLFALLAPDLETRQRFIAHLGDAGVKAVFHYVPLHSAPMGRTFSSADLPVTDSVSERLVRLPLFSALDDNMVERVVAAVESF